MTKLSQFSIRSPEQTARLLLSAALILLLGTGCQRPLANGPLSDPVWDSVPAGPDPTLDAFLATYPAQVARAVSPNARLDAPAMRRLVLMRHPRVLTAQAALAGALARRGSAGKWPNPEAEAKAMWNEASDMGIEAVLHFTLPIGGRLGAARREADLGITMAEADLAAAWKSALLELEEELVLLAGAHARLDLRESLSERSAQYAELARQRQATSMADPLDVSLVLADAAKDHRALISSRNEVHHCESKLRLLLGQSPRHDAWTVPALKRIEFTETHDDLLALAQEHRDGWRRAHLGHLRAQWAATRAARERIPDLTIGPSVVQTEDETSWGASMGVPLPLFSFGGAAHKEALARRDAARIALEAEARSTVIEIDLLLMHVEALAAELAAVSGEASEAAALAFQLAQVRYEAGQIDVLHLLSVHRAYADLRLEILELNLTHRQALLELEAAVGWPLQTVATADPQETRP